jgi:DNA-directed RNA polymerase specialized sigma subunit
MGRETTYHELIDNETLLEAHENYVEHQSVHKEKVRILNVIKAAVHDAHEPNETPWINNLRNDYAEEEEFNAAVKVYVKTGNLYESLTERQAVVLYLYLCADMKLNEIAQHLQISSPGVIKNIKLIQKKARKLFGAQII